MSSLVLNRRPSRPAAVLQHALIYAALIAAFAMVIGISLGFGRAQPPHIEVASSQIDGR